VSSRLVVVEAEPEVAVVVSRLERALRRAGVELFARIDHAAGARAVGLELPDEVLLIFGDPTVGTRLMQLDPRVGLDLPLRMLVWRRTDGRTAIAYRDPRGLEFAPGLARTILDRMGALLAQLAREGAGSDQAVPPARAAPPTRERDGTVGSTERAAGERTPFVRTYRALLDVLQASARQDTEQQRRGLADRAESISSLGDTGRYAFAAVRGLVETGGLGSR
jgi:uncharacterized protein (DUF302 family)